MLSSQHHLHALTAFLGFHVVGLCANEGFQSNGSKSVEWVRNDELRRELMSEETDDSLIIDVMLIDGMSL